MWRTLRIAFLLMVLLCVAFTAYVDRERSVSWRSPLWVGIFPVAGDTSERTSGFIAGLSPQDFQPIAEFMRREATRRGRGGDVLHLRLHPGPFPAPPERSASHGAVANVIWSLRLRWYAWRRMRQITGPPPTVRLFVIYHDPARTVKVPHSVGLQKGLVGVVHVFATRDSRGSNQVVIAHELLHTLGATDKYGADDLPSWPDGYGDPAQQPRLPQRRAELMAGRRAISEHVAEIPSGFDEVVVGDATAREIRWIP
jgi:hypothetical protein